MTPVYAPPNFVGGVFLGPIAWEAEFDLPEPAEPKALLTVAEAARVLGMGRTTVNEMTNCGDLPVTHVRGKKRIRRDDLDAFLKHGSRMRRRSA
jgi:excisionase family DNA binding protein